MSLQGYFPTSLDSLPLCPLVCYPLAVWVPFLLSPPNSLSPSEWPFPLTSQFFPSAGLAGTWPLQEKQADPGARLALGQVRKDWEIPMGRIDLLSLERISFSALERTAGRAWSPSSQTEQFGGYSSLREVEASLSHFGLFCKQAQLFHSVGA